MDQSTKRQRRAYAQASEHLSDPIVKQSLHTLCKVIQENFASNNLANSCDESSLSSIVLKFQTTMERLCGKDAMKPPPITMIPAHIFSDFKKGGAMHTVLDCLIKRATDLKMDSLDSIFSSSDRELSALLIKVEKSLVESHLIERPKVFLNKVPVAFVSKLSKITQDHGGSLVNAENDASHIVNWNEEVDTLPETIDDDYIRILAVKGDRGASVESQSNPKDQLPISSAFVHWWYFPSSYDEWLSHFHLETNEPPDLSAIHAPRHSARRWNVCCRFITDCAIFNEWGVELDYENDDDDEAVPTDPAGDTVESSKSSTKKPQRNRKKLSASSIGLAAAFPKPQISNRLNRDHVVLGAVTGVEKLMADHGPQHILNIAAATTIDSKSSNSNESLIGNKRKAGESGSDGGSSWFDQDKISDFERSHLPASVLGSDASYLGIRNSILELYKALRDKAKSADSVVLTATECRKKIAGDVGRILQVHNFLNAFGLINGNSTASARYQSDLTLNTVRCSNSKVDESSSSAALDSVLVECIKASRGPGQDSLNWEKVASELFSRTGLRYSALQCCSHFVGTHLSDPSLPTADNRLTVRHSSHSKDPALRPLLNDACSALLSQSQSQLDSLASQIIDAKLVALKKKLQLLEDVEEMVEIESTRIDIDRSDIQIQRARLAILQQQALPLPSQTSYE